ncbi:MAG: hypothetical protein KME35_14775 [Aphanocapsa sp. GSE-SYN-MK-11-07L]|jgi:hypothetical protein|nr:hypothetical protein [Aphanocapsa sp. GSE-SYN-MK-11-07L]
MVERPIKRSEQTPSALSQDPEAASGQRNDRRDRKKGKGDRKGEQEKPPVNLALMRGPRPRPEKPVVEEPAELIESIAEASDVESSEALETVETVTASSDIEPTEAASIAEMVEISEVNPSKATPIAEAIEAFEVEPSEVAPVAEKTEVAVEAAEV